MARLSATSLALGLVMLAGACTSKDSNRVTGGKPPGPPETTSTSSATGTDVTSTTMGMTAGEACPCTDGFCAAPIDIVPSDTGGETDRTRGRPPDTDFVCRDYCIPNGSANVWCWDASSCCDPDAMCTEDGFCRGPGVATTGATDGSTGTGGTGGSSTGGSTGGGSTGTDGSTGAAGMTG